MDCPLLSLTLATRSCLQYLTCTFLHPDPCSVSLALVSPSSDGRRPLKACFVSYAPLVPSRLVVDADKYHSVCSFAPPRCRFRSTDDLKIRTRSPDLATFPAVYAIVGEQCVCRSCRQ